MLWGYFLQSSYELWLLVFNTTFNKYVSFCQFGCEEIGIHEYNYGTSRKTLKPSITKSAVQYTLPRAKINLTTSEYYAKFTGSIMLSLPVVLC
jgi:hypothetical protein